MIVRRVHQRSNVTLPRTKISLITPCWNAAALIGDTLASVANQTAVRSGRVALEHIVVDGASTDDTPRIVEQNTSESLTLISEPDSGMYDALAKGLRRATGDWITFLNAGDLLAPDAFETLFALTSSNESRWITGRSVMIDESGRKLRDDLPFRYRRSLLAAGQYCRRPPFFLPFLQQEGTFWHQTLQATIDFDQLAKFRLAGDYYLWTRFATECEPTIVNAFLGAFRRHSGQLSEDRAAYHREVESIAKSPSVADMITAAMDAVRWLVRA